MIEVKKASAHGGARPGAGRHRSGEAKASITFFISQKDVIKARCMARKEGLPIGTILSDSVRRRWDEEGYTMIDYESYEE